MKPLEKDISIISHVLSYCEQIEETMDRFARKVSFPYRYSSLFIAVHIHISFTLRCRAMPPSDRGAGRKAFVMSTARSLGSK